MTDTLTESVSLERGTLVLVTLTENYARSGEEFSWLRDHPSADETSRTFYATASRDMGAGWVTLVVPDADERHGGTWALDVRAFGLETVLDDGKAYRGWNVPSRYVTLTPVDTPPNPTSWVRMHAGSPVAVGDRVRYADVRGEGDSLCAAEPGDLATVTYVATDGDLIRVTFDDGHESLRSRFRFERGIIPTRPSIELDKEKRAALPIQEAYPVGSVWNHQTYGDMPFTVTGHRGSGEVIVTGREHVNNPWVRGALDSFGTFVGWDEAQNTPQDATESPVTTDESTGGTFTRADVDAAVRQALEEFKERANRIAVEYAEANDLCGNFERAMDDIGLLGREEWHDTHDPERTYDISFVVTVRGVEARDESDAQDKARDELYNELPSNMDQDIRHYSTYVRD